MRFAWYSGLLIACALGLLSAGCGGARPPAVTTSPAEDDLLRVMRADQFLLITHLERDADGDLIVSTRQGEGTPRYRIRHLPNDKLRIEAIEDRVTMHHVSDGFNGTGPAARGLTR